MKLFAFWQRYYFTQRFSSEEVIFTNVKGLVMLLVIITVPENIK
jgi:hypothetical protein